VDVCVQELDCIVNQMMTVAEYLGWDVSELKPVSFYSLHRAVTDVAAAAGIYRLICRRIRPCVLSTVAHFLARKYRHGDMFSIVTALPHYLSLPIYCVAQLFLNYNNNDNKRISVYVT